MLLSAKTMGPPPFFNLLILEREISNCCFTHLHSHWLCLVCPLTGDQTCNLGIWRQYSNQLSYPARVWICFFVGCFLSLCAMLLHLYSQVHENKHLSNLELLVSGNTGWGKSRFTVCMKNNPIINNNTRINSYTVNLLLPHLVLSCS